MRIFSNSSEKRLYLKRFRQLAQEHQVQVHAYCLMSNHVHFLLTPAQHDSLAKLFQRLHTWWAGWKNKKLGRTGHLFQSRFHSSPVDETHYWNALRYIERNPKRAKWREDLGEWEYSSARARLRGEADEHLDVVQEPIRHRGWGPQQYREFLDDTDEAGDQLLRRCLPGNRPCGSAEWIREREQRYQRRLAWARPGRPKLRREPEMQAA